MRDDKSFDLRHSFLIKSYSQVYGDNDMSVDIEELSAKDLKALIEKASDKLSAKAEEEKASVRAEVEELVQKHGYTISELFGVGKSSKPKTKLSPTHRDPENSENTWTGRGRQPKWLNAALEAGGNFEDYKIKS